MLMFRNVSMTGTGVAIALIVALLEFLGVETSETDVTNMVEGVVTAVSAILIVWGQVRRADLRYGLFRK